MKKKGQLQTLAPSIILLVIAAVFLVLGLVVMQSMRDVDIVAKANSNTTVNETLSAVSNTTEVDLNCKSKPGSNSFAVVTMLNKTDGAAISAANYIVNANGTVIATDAGAVSTFNATDWHATATCSFGGSAYISANTTIVGLGTFGDFWEIIVLAIVIAIVIGMLLVIFGGRNQR